MYLRYFFSPSSFDCGHLINLTLFDELQELSRVERVEFGQFKYLTSVRSFMFYVPNKLLLVTSALLRPKNQYSAIEIHIYVEVKTFPKQFLDQIFVNKWLRDELLRFSKD